MIKFFIQALIMLACVTHLSAQEAKQLFINMPDSILPTLTKINREDCIDFLASNMRAQVKNRFDSQSEMTSLTKDHITMQLSDKSFFEMKLLPINDSTQIICTIRTVCSDACDSHIQFYTSQWESLASQEYITLPIKSDFIADTIPAHIADTLKTQWHDLYQEADLLLMQANFADSLNTLTFSYTTPSYMNKESAQTILPLLRSKAILYEWENGKFIRRD